MGARERASGKPYSEALHSHIAEEAFLATLSRNSRFMVARRSFHEVHLYEPNLVTDASLQVITAVRSQKALTGAR